MYFLPFTQTQKLSFHFLADIAGKSTPDKGMQFAVKGQTLLLSQSVKGANPAKSDFDDIPGKAAKLIIFGEGLSLEKLHDLEVALSSVLQFSYYQIKQRADGQDDLCLVARVSQGELEEVNSLLEKVATAYQIELVYLPHSPSLSEPGLLLMDMDSTVIDVECIDEIAKLAGVGEQVSEVTELAMQGKLDFAQSLTSRVACLEHAPEQILTQVRNALPLMPGLTRLITLLKQRHWKVAIASGGFTFFADYLKERLELDAAVANTLDIQQGKLTGNVVGDIVDANVKANTLLALSEQWQIDPKQTVAMGDGANDLVMMNHAALGVAFHAKPIVREQAAAAIRFSGLDSLLWMLDD